MSTLKQVNFILGCDLYTMRFHLLRLALTSHVLNMLVL